MPRVHVALSGAERATADRDGLTAVTVAASSTAYELEATFRGRSIDGPEKSMQCLALLPDGRIIGSIGATVDIVLKVWHRTKPPRPLYGHRGTVRCVAALPGGRAVSGGNDNDVLIWDLVRDGGALSRILRGHTDSVTCVAYHNECVVSGSEDHTVKQWNLNTSTCTRTLSCQPGFVTCVATIPDGLAYGYSDGMLEIWGPDYDVLKTWDSGAAPNPRRGSSGGCTCSHTVLDIAALPDTRIACVSYGSIRIWDTNDGHLVRTLLGHGGLATCVAVLPEDRLVSASKLGDLMVWDLKDGRCLQKLTADSGRANCVVVLPDHRIASGSGDYTLNVWVNTAQLMEKPLAREVARQRLCGDVMREITQFL